MVAATQQMNTQLADSAHPLSATTWPATLSLQLAKTARGMRLVSTEHNGPLYVQKPFYPEGDELAHVYLLHPPGGLVSGDQLAIDLNLSHDAKALFTTPGAARIYRRRKDGLQQEQHVRLSIEHGGFAEWLPMENIVYPKARGQLTTRVELKGDAGFIGWEISCLGLPASNAPFDEGILKQSFEIWRDNKPLVIDRFLLDANESGVIDGRVGLQSYCVNGVMIAGPITDGALAQELTAKLRELTMHGEGLAAITAIGEFLIIRSLAQRAENVRRYFTDCWQVSRPELLGRKACHPRIWLT